ncbi:DUF438 domain-containing protein [Streptococcus sanguinis]|uniref:DUF438 domain-containing protein n=1 Tax=Streptococcus sanguinis TaxID=1305 RepID=UPI001CBD6A0C|nr:DUF438 domain-containing protein [Streptococcus sanguinis]MBZ2022286.1 DUF438 domain-containing protein [Streptococcus sanguinis]MBZ2046985.1 DUF438 domain-containing protein [Streptococcus sanguinis]MBZ2050320.1 DUF438 domain-containing protein [Streptococcus sanguinis]MBZ2058553.1 DUF438 domain-containing protein [Streptococcus sanguinis]MCC3177522.1 sensory box protein [Streptococcus sanguinis]
MATERIEVLKSILLDLHNGASAESVQELFNEHFAGVSAIEISLMEHELMNSDTGVTFEDVMSLCNVHANLFKGAIQDVEVADTDHPGHPIQVFKQENLALRAALMRVRRLLSTYETTEDEDLLPEICKGLQRQLSLVGQFDIHYQRKEELMFPIMESYGHDSPPKVMWGVDDQIRDLFQEAKIAAEQLPDTSIQEVKDKFEAFAAEFEAMIFKEESILLMILLESFHQDDWLKIAEESDAYGYAIIKPTEKWIPARHSFSEEEVGDAADEGSEAPASTEQTSDGRFQQVIDTPDGQVTISFKPKEKKEQAINRDSQQPFGHGYLSVAEANLILDHLPMEITFVNKDDIFQYYNDSVPADEMIFKRTPSQIGRNVELCHPPKFLDKVRRIFKALREGERDKFEMWFKSESRGKFVHVTYAAVRDEAGEFQGVLEYVQDIQPFRDIDSDFYRDLD